MNCSEEGSQGRTNFEIVKVEVPTLGGRKLNEQLVNGDCRANHWQNALIRRKNLLCCGLFKWLAPHWQASS